MRIRRKTTRKTEGRVASGVREAETSGDVAKRNDAEQAQHEARAVLTLRQGGNGNFGCTPVGPCSSST